MKIYHISTLRSGAVILGAYTSKIRKTLFAQLKDKIKTREISSQEVARAADELNKTLYTLFVEKLKLEKGDVVRISIDYEIEEQKISGSGIQLRSNVLGEFLKRK